MFCDISKNWRGRPLETHEGVVNLIGAITTSQGLRIWAELDNRTYKTGVPGQDKEFAQIPVESSTFHGEQMGPLDAFLRNAGLWVIAFSTERCIPTGCEVSQFRNFAIGSMVQSRLPSSSGAWSGCVANLCGECSYTLKRKFRISPSSTTYVFPSTRSFPCSLTFCSLPARMNSSYFITSARINPLSISE